MAETRSVRPECRQHGHWVGFLALFTESGPSEQIKKFVKILTKANINYWKPFFNSIALKYFSGGKGEVSRGGTLKCVKPLECDNLRMNRKLWFASLQARVALDPCKCEHEASDADKLVTDSLAKLLITNPKYSPGRLISAWQLSWRQSSVLPIGNMI